MEIIIGLFALIISVILHELMHGVIGDRLGDPTPRLLGRLTLNPIKHIDPIGSIVVPAVFILQSTITGVPFVFGWAKPVPINPLHFKDPRKDMALVALAGPATNFALAAAAAIIYKLIFQNESLLTAFTQGPSVLGLGFLFIANLITINLALAFLNLVPIPPLDGSKILQAFLPESLAISYEKIAPYGFFILLALFFIPGPLNLSSILDTLMTATLSFFGLL